MAGIDPLTEEERRTLPVPDAGDWPVEQGAIRETCAICGMVANIDPTLHTSRYGHRPEVWRAGQRWRFSFQTYAFTEPMAA